MAKTPVCPCGKKGRDLCRDCEKRSNGGYLLGATPQEVVFKLRLMLAEVASVIPLVANDPDGEINRLVNLFEPIKSLLKETKP